MKNPDDYEIAIIDQIDIDDHVNLIRSITNWSTVTEEEYNLLSRFARNCGYTIIVRRDVNDRFLPNLIEKCLVEAKKLEEEMVQRRKEADEAKLKRKLKKLAKIENDEKRLLEELQKKYGVVNE
jgi:hypothetical protein